jgi:hypothetical protein
MTTPVLVQTLLFLAAGVTLVMMMGRRRKRKAVR